MTDTATKTLQGIKESTRIVGLSCALVFAVAMISAIAGLIIDGGTTMVFLVLFGLEGSPIELTDDVLLLVDIIYYLIIWAFLCSVVVLSFIVVGGKIFSTSIPKWKVHKMRVLGLTMFYGGVAALICYPMSRIFPVSEGFLRPGIPHNFDFYDAWDVILTGLCGATLTFFATAILLSVIRRMKLFTIFSKCWGAAACGAIFAAYLGSIQIQYSTPAFAFNIAAATSIATCFYYFRARKEWIHELDNSTDLEKGEELSEN